MDAIFLAIDGQQQGPFSLEQVREAVGRGEYLPETLAWHEGLAGWTPLSNLLAATSRNTALPPVPEQPGTPVLTPTTAGAGDFTRDELRDIARRQNMLMWSLVAGVVAYVLAKLVPLIGLFALLGAIIFEIYALYTLARAVRTRAAWAYCILLFIPLVSLITLVVFSGKASRILKAHGIPVGFMGGKASAFT